MKANFLPAVILAFAAFDLFRWSYLRFSRPVARVMLIVIGLAAAIPAVLMAGNYAFTLPYAQWFNEFRAAPGAEITAGLCGCIVGVMFASARLRPNRLNAPILAFVTLAAVGLLVTPFAKQILFPIDRALLENKWDGDVCIPTTHSTCVPACVATYMRMQGVSFTEPELALATGTSQRGTEYWYLKRALRKRGYEPKLHYVRSVRNAPVPSILSVRVGRIGHVVVLLARNDKEITIAEPLRGRRHYEWPLFMRCYRPSGLYTTISRSPAR